MFRTCRAGRRGDPRSTRPPRSWRQRSRSMLRGSIYDLVVDLCPRRRPTASACPLTSTGTTVGPHPRRMCSWISGADRPRRQRCLAAAGHADVGERLDGHCSTSLLRSRVCPGDDQDLAQPRQRLSSTLASSSASASDIIRSRPKRSFTPSRQCRLPRQPGCRSSRQYMRIRRDGS
jgi:hypothetical protein